MGSTPSQWHAQSLPLGVITSHFQRIFGMNPLFSGGGFKRFQAVSSGGGMGGGSVATVRAVEGSAAGSAADSAAGLAAGSAAGSQAARVDVARASRR